ncbi:MAG: segregation/condensation protein A [Chloroflexi bacterium]|nr:segregation/condensation protein A [Chloroflexota bacterium]
MTVSRRPAPPVLQLGEFSGPLDLLLTLVERRRLPIAELSLVAVADQYLAQVRSLNEVDPDLLSEFLAIAARLLLLKSRSLLPAIEPPAPPELAEETDGAELVRRLEAYRSFRALAEALGRLDAAGLSSYGHGAHKLDLPPESVALQAIAPEILRSLYLAIEKRRNPGTADEETIRPRISVAERLFLLRGLLTTEKRINWQAVCGETVDEIVATLLAVLELVRRGEIVIVQSALFGPITLEAGDQPSIPVGDDALPSESELAGQ